MSRVWPCKAVWPCMARDMRADPREASVTSSVCGAWSEGLRVHCRSSLAVCRVHIALAVCLTQKVHTAAGGERTGLGLNTGGAITAEHRLLPFLRLAQGRHKGQDSEYTELCLTYCF